MTFYLIYIVSQYIKQTELIIILNNVYFFYAKDYLFDMTEETSFNTEGNYNSKQQRISAGYVSQLKNKMN